MSKIVTIALPLEIAERIANGLSDIALWCHGFNAALSQDEGARRPWGTDAVTDINLRLKNGIDVAGEPVDLVDEALTDVMVMAYHASDAARSAGDVKGHAVAAYIHDQIVEAKLKRKGLRPLGNASPWPFPNAEGGQ